MLTQRAALLGFVAFCFYLIAVVNTLPSFYYALTWLAIGVLGSSLGLALLSLIGLECKFRVARARSAAYLGEEGEGPQIAIYVANGGTLNKTNIVLELRLRDVRNQTEAHRFLLEAVPSGVSIEARLPLPHLRRGYYRLDGGRLVGSDVLGLFRMQKKLVIDEDEAGIIVVGPPLIRVSSIEGSGRGGGRSGSQRVIRSGHGDELRGTRPYSPGDDLRHVHWKSSARAGELVVKEFEQTGRETALVIWDGATGTTWGRNRFDSTEWSLSLCASLCQALLSSATPCDFARLDESPMLVQSRSLTSGELPMALLDALAGGHAERKSTLEAATFGLSGLGSRTYSSVFLVTASLAGDVLENARFWRSRGARVQILLVDGASLGSRVEERRFRGRGTKTPTQKDGDRSIPVTADSYAAQEKRLRQSGIEVVRVAATEDEPVRDLSGALYELWSSPRSSPSSRGVETTSGLH